MRDDARPQPQVGKGPGQHCHELIRATAIEMAGELYDLMMQNNEQWAEWQAMHPMLSKVELEIRFIELKWPELIEDARATLAQMLGGNIGEDLKERIFDALVKDEPLRRARQAWAATNPSVTQGRIGKLH